MYPDLLSGELDASPSPQASPAPPRAQVYPSLQDSSVDELEKFLDSDPEPMDDSGPSSKYPANIQAFADGSFKCHWCEKLLFGDEQLEGHLQGKEHRKKCLNSDISPYGMPDHFKQVEEYVSAYGHNLYARLRHWPVCIVETAYDWACEVCKKRFQTQASVNQHLEDPEHVSRSQSPTRVRNSPQPAKVRPLSAERTDSLDDRPVKRKESEKRLRPSSRVPSPIRARAEEMDRLARISAMVDFEARKCKLCWLSFETLKQTEEHVEQPRHLANYLQFAINKFI